MKKVSKAIIPCAGLGTRFLPYTKACPKEMLPIIDTPVLQMIVEEIVEAGISEICIIDNENKGAISAHFQKNQQLEDILQSRGGEKYASEVAKIASMADFTFVKQQDPMGSAHAVSLCEEFANGEPVALLFGDDLVKTSGVGAIGQLISAYEIHKKTVLGVQEVLPEMISKYSSIKIESVQEDGVYEISDILEKPSIAQAPSNIAALGRYILTPDVFQFIKKTPRGVGGEYQITDTFQLMAKEGLVVAKTYQGRRYDTGNKNSYLEAVVDYALENPEIAPQFKEYLKKVAKSL